jgi:hypothetical protein
MNRNDVTLDTPVALAIFKRADKTCRIIQTLKKARPKQLFIFGDGPRPSKPDEFKQVEETRRRVMEEVDWPCQVRTNFFEENVGGPIRIPSGLDWVFGHVDRTIFIEDDIILSTDFLFFAEELLNYYENDHRIGIVSGRNPVTHRARDGASYFFHIMPNTGGCFGLWKRTWDIFSRNMSEWSRQREQGLLYKSFSIPQYAKKQEQIYDKLYDGTRNNWDYFFNYCFITHGYLSIVPSQNQVKKDGADEQAQHRSSVTNEAEIEPLQWSIRHPRKITPSRAYERKMFERKYPSEKKVNKIRQKAVQIIKKAGRKAIQFVGCR